MPRIAHRPLLAIGASAALAVAGTIAPGLAGQTFAAASTKVVIVVGPVGNPTTQDYIDVANAAATVARKYTSNVTTIYSPYATWSAVSSALNGANIVLYLGHGNGFPSPYSSTLNYASMDGMGLNASAGNGNYNWTYYGEKYVRTLHFAPYAAVIFARLCYASGDSEWGAGKPSLSVAEQRVDNYAAPWYQAGAREVIADGLGDPGWYIAQLFTRHSTIDNLWLNAPDAFHNVVSFGSPRSYGFIDRLDVGTYSYVPDGDPYYRSIAELPNVSTDTIVGAGQSSSALRGTMRYDYVNVRKGPGTGYGIVTSLNSGATVSVTGAIRQDGSGRTWAPIRTSWGATGWIASSFAAFSGSAAATTWLNVRTSPSTSASVRTVVAQGARFTVTGSTADSLARTWFAVRLASGATGWVAAWYTTP